MTQTTIKTRRLYPGGYITRNTYPVARIEKEEFGWRVSYDGYSGLWPTKAECMLLLESTATYDKNEHSCPITVS